MAARQHFFGSVKSVFSTENNNQHEEIGLVSDNGTVLRQIKQDSKTIRSKTAIDTLFKAVKECGYLENKIKDSIRVG